MECPVCNEHSENWNHLQCRNGHIGWENECIFRTCPRADISLANYLDHLKEENVVRGMQRIINGFLTTLQLFKKAKISFCVERNFFLLKQDYKTSLSFVWSRLFNHKRGRSNDMWHFKGTFLTHTHTHTHTHHAPTACDIFWIVFIVWIILFSSKSIKIKALKNRKSVRDTLLNPPPPTLPHPASYP